MFPREIESKTRTSVTSSVNVTSARHHGHPLWGALTNTVVASLTLILIIAVMRVPTAGARALADAPAWSWLGGTMGAVMVLSAIILAPRNWFLARRACSNRAITGSGCPSRIRGNDRHRIR